MLALCLALPGAAVCAQSSLFEIDFNHSVIGPNVRCDGQVRVEHGELMRLQEVFFDQDDRIEGDGWVLTTEGTTEETAGRRKVCMSLKPKGVQVEFRAAGEAHILVTSQIGGFDFWVSQLPAEGTADFLGGSVSVRRLPRSTRLTTETSEDDFTSIASGPEGSLFAVWQTWNGELDRIMLSRRGSGGWSEPEPVTDRPGDVLGPRALSDGDGGLWVVWSERRAGDWDLYGRRLRRSGWTPTTRLTIRLGADFNHRLALDSMGRAWVVWQAATPRGFDILAGRLTTVGIRDTVVVAGTDASEWSPAVTADARGLWVAWDSYEGPDQSYDVLFRRLEDGELGPVLQAAAGPDYEAHPSLTCDHLGRLWIAYDKGGPDWGRHPKPGLRLHGKRSLHLVCYDGDRFFEPSVPFGTGFEERFGPMCELPTIAADDSGLWVVFRHLNDIKEFAPANKQRPFGQPRCSWNVYATRYAGGRWSAPQELPESNGRNDKIADVEIDREGRLWVGYAADGRYRWRAEEPVNHNAYVAQVARPAGSGIGLRPVVPAAGAGVAIAEEGRHAITTADGEFTLVYGDTHRHTDISRCGMNYDGSLMDTYRYAVDAAGLDFIAISDHDQDILRHRYGRPVWSLPSYAWWRSGKYADLMLNDETFVAFHAYEHGGSTKQRGGHKNVIYARRNGPCIEEDEPAALFSALAGYEATAIPHQLGDGGSRTDWDKWNGEWERVAEIFQARGSYEFVDAPRQAAINTPGHTIWDALGKGVRVGIIASSDHGQTHSAYAGVYVREVSREGILEGLKARRTFGGTEKIVLELRVGDDLMGSEVTLAGVPRFTAEVRGTQPLKRVDIVKDGAFAYNVDPDGSDLSFAWEDLDTEPGGESYYYLRAIQDDNEIAWSSPIWVNVAGA